jgi:hypothetical protein
VEADSAAWLDAEDPAEILVAVEYANQIDSIGKREIEQQCFFETVAHRYSAHTLQITPGTEERLSALGMFRGGGDGVIRGVQKPVRHLQRSVFGLHQTHR